MPCVCCIIFGFNINTTAFCLGRSSLHLQILKSSMPSLIENCTTPSLDVLTIKSRLSLMPFMDKILHFQASADLTLTRFRFLQNFGIFSKSVNETSISMEILQTRLFPPLADYLDSMEICLMSAVKTSGTNNINLFLL